MIKSWDDGSDEVTDGLKQTWRLARPKSQKLADPANSNATFEELAIHYVSTTGAAQSACDSWVKRTFPNLRAFPFDIEGAAAVSQAQVYFDALLIGDGDLRRLTRFVTENLPALTSKPKIAVTQDSTAKKRANLLTAGFDDVFDISKMDPSEALARVFAIRTRYALAQQELGVKRGSMPSLNEVAYTNQLTPRERKILMELLEASGQFCKYDQLSGAIAAYGKEISAENLKVIISNLRKKLKRGFAINARINSGYELRSLPSEF